MPDETEQTEQAAPEQAEQQPDTGGEPDWKAEADKWKALARKHEGAAKSNSEAARKLKEIEDANKSELEKAQERIAAAEKAASESSAAALRLEVALDKAPEGMSLAQVRKLAKRLTGGSREELEADADDLFAEFVAKQDGGESSRRPKERLRPGASPDDEPEDSPQKLTDAVLARRGY